MKKLKHKLAIFVHDLWAGWMIYMWKVSSKRLIAIDGVKEWCVVIHPDKVKRWERQMNTPFDDLPEEEKDSDWKTASEIIEIFHEAFIGRNKMG